MIPEGIYIGRATAIGIETTMKGKEYVSADFDIETEDGEADTVEWRGWLTPAALERTIESLRLMGWHGDDIYELARDGALRNEVSLDVRHEEYKNKVTARVSFINSKEVDLVAVEKKKQALAERIKKVAAKTKPENPPAEDDDLPF